ncbi:MAG: CBS and ACT domain-containing protein [Desulfotomaculaceae bacterium]|nr:CBS and ACT domain-containing protein [Desulfotomaculaceae bacterium]MDD4767433.1 CBS and ACT domain-containing protein [Desulfotomaculaceae bacterium]
MKIKDRMSSGNIKTVQLESSLTDAFRIMKESHIRRLPVMDDTKLVGIVTLSDLHQASPSSATALSVHELNYLLAKIKIKDIVPKKQKLLTVSSEDFIETAARIMRQHTVGGLPVVDEGKLVGIITETDIFDAFIDILGFKKPHSRIDVYIVDRPGALGDLIGIISCKGISLLNTIAYYDRSRGMYKAILRVEALAYEPIVEEIKNKGYEVDSAMATSGEDN